MDDIDWEGISRRLKEWVAGNYANLSKNSTLPTEERDNSNALISSALGVVGVNNEAINQDIKGAFSEYDLLDPYEQNRFAPQIRINRILESLLIEEPLINRIIISLV